MTGSLIRQAGLRSQVTTKSGRGQPQVSRYVYVKRLAEPPASPEVESVQLESRFGR